jgi:hypothetical protein
VIKRILGVEKESWKEDWRRSRRGTDEHLLLLCRALTRISGRAHDLVYFLELNGETIAYNLVLNFKQSAFMVKMSFNERYRKLYPGVFLTNEVVRETFNRQTTRSIDFLSALPFQKRWAPRYLGRVGLCMCRKGILPTILVTIMMSKFAATVLGLVSRLNWRRGLLEH